MFIWHLQTSNLRSFGHQLPSPAGVSVEGKEEGGVLTWESGLFMNVQLDICGRQRLDFVLCSMPAVQVTATKKNTESCPFLV